MIDPLDHLKAALADRYSIERELGRGGMAIVYLAQDLKHHRPVALKVVQPELANVLGAERFLREIEIAAKLSHPHILPLLDSGGADQPAVRPADRTIALLYYVMPYVEGESLRERLNREKQLSVDDALKISREVADALSYAHSRGVVHRDIKPENILLQSGHAVVADFGIARAIDQAGGERLTTTGLAIGTPAYMSPEQAAGSKDLDGRSDLYSLGCVLYEMLAGKPPFTGPTVESLVHQHLTVDPPSVTTMRPAVPAQVAVALQRALAKTPADRFNPVALFAEAIAPPAAAVTTAPPASPPGLPRRWSNTRVALLAAVVVVVAIGAVLVGRRSVRIPSSAALAADRVVVLPFDNRSGEPDLDAVGQMAAEWITEGLMQTGAVQVVPNFMVAEAISQSRDAEGAVSPAMVAERTQARIVVMGSYYRRGSDLEFHSEVVDVASGSPFATIDPVWGSAADPRGAIDSVRIQVMGGLAMRLSPLIGWELPPTVQPPTYEASQAYVRGIEEWANADFDGAARSFELAYALDTTYLRSLMLASAAHGNAGRRARSDSLLAVIEARRNEVAPYDRYRLEYLAANRRGDRAAALAAARAGVKLVPIGTLRWGFIGSLISSNRPREALQSIQEIHRWFVETTGGRLYYHWQAYVTALHELGQHERELEVAREARAHVSGPLFAVAWEGAALAALGRLDELTSAVDAILLAAPQSVLTNGEALAEIAEELRSHGHPEAALDVVDRALEWYDDEPDESKVTVRGRLSHARLLYLRERWVEADTVFAALAADSTFLVYVVGHRGAIAAHRGAADSARRFATELAELRLGAQPGGNTCWRARIAAILGEKENAVSLLRRAFAEGLGFGIWLHRDIDFESLREYPAFEELLQPEG